MLAGIYMIKIVNPDQSGIFFVKIQPNAPGQGTLIIPRKRKAVKVAGGSLSPVPTTKPAGSNNCGRVTEPCPHHETGRQ
jgi:hypothetical protein